MMQSLFQLPSSPLIHFNRKQENIVDLSSGIDTPQDSFDACFSDIEVAGLDNIHNFIPRLNKIVSHEDTEYYNLLQRLSDHERVDYIPSLWVIVGKLVPLLESVGTGN